MPARGSRDWEVGLVRGAIASLFLYLLARTWADPDLWGHLRFGRDIVAAGSVHVADPYTFTGLGTWVNPSWLADVLMYGAWAWGGTAGLVAAKVVVAAAIVLVAAATLHRRGVRGPALDLLSLCGLAAVYPSVLTVRPQLFALLLFALLVHVQAAEASRWRLRLVATPVLLAVWANFHGSWVLGLAEVLLWSAGELIARDRTGRERVQLAATALLAALATVATPYGTALWWRLSGAMTPVLQDVSEWRSLPETSWALVVVWGLLVAMGAAAALGRRLRASEVLVLGWLAWSSWRVSRLVQFFGLATLGFAGAPLLAGRAQRARPEAGAARTPLATRVLVVVCGAVVIAGSVAATLRSMRCLHMDYSRQADVCAARFIALNRLDGRLLAYSDWGLYAVWHFAPALRVSLDGRREFAYPAAELARHATVYWNEPGALAAVDALAPDYVWLPRGLPVVPALRTSAEWRVIFETDRSVVLARASAAGRPWRQPRACELPPCFPADPVS